MPYRNVEVQKLASSVTIERCGNGFVIRPEYPSRSYDERSDDNEVYTDIKDALKAAEKAVTRGFVTNEEKWVDDDAGDAPRTRRAKY